MAITDAYQKRNFAETVHDCFGSAIHPILAFPDGLEAQSGFKYYSPADLNRLSRKAAAFLLSNGVPVRKSGDKPLKITIFAYGTIEWAACFYAIVQMGHTAVSLSSRLSEEYVQGLLAKSNADVLLHDRPVTMPSNLTNVHKVDMPTEQKLEALAEKSDSEVYCDYTTAIDPEDDVYYAHSSGSTSLPKLFPVSHREWLARMRHCEQIILPDERSWCASAMYNAVGLIQISLAVSKSVPVFFENDRVQFTVEGAVKFVQEARPDKIGITPWTLGMLATVPKGIEGLRHARRVEMFGAVCSDELGDKLVAEGVKLASLYATTESSAMAGSSSRPEGDDEWQWLSIIPPKKQHIEMRPLDGSEELWQLWCKPGCPEVLPTVKDKDGAFCTGDLFLKHPTKENRWKCVGRQDDHIKIYQKDRQSIINAIVYEQTIHRGNKDVVDEVVLFGQGRGSLGALVFAEDLPVGSHKRAEAEKRIWHTVQSEVNGKLPTPIDKNMIVFVDIKRTSLPQTGKFNIIRPQIYLKFQHLIDQAYDNQASEPTVNGKSSDATTNGNASEQKHDRPNGLHRTESCGSEHGAALTNGHTNGPSAKYVS
ncbi:uncharacterized protein AB675_6886 [Cyphellophora attinorum]|uniref:AMP-dependent synthetase/ligase domain-containing protein n=1 Tax=Cyphellophora attinorum TaxID=1664694 RepID=A0A0N0NQA6_9EURO|nr:uncharacterized protein AB675_6886 [Phialophora attinorum]KPI43479.1 hypothetical protein AB675_6886 [Phialophora attinorum]